jgi:hypothetical protein
MGAVVVAMMMGAEVVVAAVVAMVMVEKESGVEVHDLWYLVLVQP